MEGSGVKHIIVQAGGRGSRMESLTRNKPKALVPVDGLPMIFHLFRRFPEKEFIIIGDYKKETCWISRLHGRIASMQV